MKEYNWSSLSKISGVLAIVFSGIFCCSLIVDEYGMVPYNSPYWDLVYNLIWIGLVGILLFTASWFFCLSKTEYDCWKTLSKKVGVLAIAFSVLFFLPFIISALLEDAFFVIWIGLAGASIFGVLWLLSSSKSKSVKEEIKATEIKEQRKEGNSYVGPIILGIIVGLSTFFMEIGPSDNEDSTQSSEIEYESKKSFRSFYSYYDAAGNKILINLNEDGTGTIRKVYARTSSGLESYMSNEPIACSWEEYAYIKCIEITSRSGDIYIRDGYAYFEYIDMKAKDIKRGCKLN